MIRHLSLLTALLTSPLICATAGGDAIDNYVVAQIKKRNVPGLSLAVIHDGVVVKAKGYGVTEKEGETPVTTTTLFQAGSISKPVAAAGALRLVEEGKLTLDGEVNEKLRTWKVSDNEFTKEKKVTLRGLLSHTAGLTVHGFPGYDREAPIPSVVEVLDGAKPANTAAVRVGAVPGSRWKYSGGGYTVAQLLMSDVTGEPFPKLMRESVLGPLGMDHSTFEQPLPDDRAKSAAAGVYADGKAVKGRWHVYPEMAAAGLWTTPTDLAKFAVGIQRSLGGKTGGVLSPEMSRRMLTAEQNNYGLGVSVEGKGSTLRFGHGGRDEGFDALMVAYAETGQGAVIMINANENSGLEDRVLRVIAAEYRWPDFPAPPAPVQHPVASVDPKTLASYEGYYDLDRDVLTLALSEGKLVAKRFGGLFDELVPGSDTTFTLPDHDLVVSVEKDDHGEVVGLRWKSPKEEKKAARLGPLVGSLRPSPDPGADLTRTIESALEAFAKGGKAVEEAAGVTPGARHDFAVGLRELSGIKSLEYLDARDVSSRPIERHGGMVSRVLYYKAIGDGEPRSVLIYLTADGLVTDLDFVR